MRRNGRRKSSWKRWIATMGAVLGVVGLVAGCSGASQDSSGSESAEVSGGSADMGSADGRSLAKSAPQEAVGSANRPMVSTRAVIRTGRVSLVSDDLAKVRAEVGQLLGRYGGYVSSEDTSNDDSGRPDRSTLVMRFAVSDFDTVMSALGDLGRERGSTSGSEDVTTEVIDVDTRVATQEASLDRLKKFLGQARDIDDIIALESEIATRQASLESLKGQQKYLADQTALSTIHLQLSTPATYVAPPTALGDAGFLAGLSGGWNAMKSVVVVALTVVGAMLPFAAAMTLVGVPGWLLLRASRRRRRLTPLAAGPTTPDAS